MGRAVRQDCRRIQRAVCADGRTCTQAEDHRRRLAQRRAGRQALGRGQAHRLLAGKRGERERPARRSGAGVRSHSHPSGQPDRTQEGQPGGRTAARLDRPVRQGRRCVQRRGGAERARVAGALAPVARRRQGRQAQGARPCPTTASGGIRRSRSTPDLRPGAPDLRSGARDRCGGAGRPVEVHGAGGRRPRAGRRIPPPP